MQQPGNDAPIAVVLDLTSGRVRGGHNTDDVKAIVEALAPMGGVRLAPYEDQPAAASRMGRFGLLRDALARLRQSGARGALVSESASRIELLQLALFSLSGGLRPLVVLRRESYGAGITRALFHGVFVYLLRRRLWNFAAYSQLVLDFWQTNSGQCGWLLAFPERPMPANWTKAHPGAVSFGLLGALRWDKGAALYGSVVEKCVALGADSRVIVQCYTQDYARPDLKLEEVVQRLRERWGAHPRVEVVDRNLSREEYAGLIAESDVGIFPYDVVSYGSGDSGILFEILSTGKIAIATPLAWAMATFGNHPNLLFIDDPAGQEMSAALGEAYRRANDPRGAAQDLKREDRFGASWHDAVAGALSTHAIPRPPAISA